MGYQPWYVGMTAPALQITLNTDNGTEDLTGISVGNISMVIRNVGVDTPTDHAGTGIFAIVAAKPAVINYVFSAADVVAAGTYQLFVKIVFSSVPGTKVYDPIPFVLTPD